MTVVVSRMNFPPSITRNKLNWIYCLAFLKHSLTLTLKIYTLTYEPLNFSRLACWFDLEWLTRTTENPLHWITIGKAIFAHHFSKLQFLLSFQICVCGSENLSVPYNNIFMMGLSWDKGDLRKWKVTERLVLFSSLVSLKTPTIPHIELVMQLEVYVVSWLM